MANYRQQRAQLLSQGALLTFAYPCLSLIVLIAACQDPLTSKKNQRSQSPENEALDQPKDIVRGEPVDVPNFDSKRVYFQSRSVITLNVPSTLVKPGDQFTLLNDTTKATLVDHQSPAAGLTDDSFTSASSWRLAATADLILRLYPLDPIFADKFTYGENNLRLIVADQNNGKASRSVITLADFPAFAFTTTTFASGEQRRGELQGGFEPFLMSTVSSAGENVLATGFLSLCNR